LDAVAWAVRTTINPAIKHSTCHLAFHHNMIFCRAININWDTIHAERRKLLQASNTKENQSRLNSNYALGDQVLIILDADERRSQPKMSTPTQGPFTTTAVHPNGTVDIHRSRATETINIRRLKPFHV
jgi:hypothetical protein